jgi:carbon catabolite-derepressing protein kinase
MPEYTSQIESAVSVPIPPARRKNNEENLSNYITLNTIGEGNYGKVRLGIDKRTGEKVALKVIHHFTVEISI